MCCEEKEYKQARNANADTILTHTIELSLSMERTSFDDVDDFCTDDHGQPQLTPEQSQTIRRANDAFRNASFEQAVKEYSKAYKVHPLAAILSNRSAAFCKMSQNLRTIPAYESERHALFGLDPMSHAALALKDAEKVVKQHSMWPKGYYRKGMALILLERYEEAQDSFLAGLQVDPTSSPLQEALRWINAEIQKDDLGTVGSFDKTKKRAKIQCTDEFDCVLCLKLLYNPVTTPCGHSFCRACLLQAMDHGNKCPMCRVVLFLSPKTYPVSVTLKNIIEKNFPKEYAARKEEMDSLALAGGNEILPLFVMDVIIPCEKICLNIFEPRYRLMVRRIMEGDHRMGMVGIDPETRSIADVACEVEITECEPLPDGRFYLEAEGRRRFNIFKSWEQDGYRVGQVMWLEDAVPKQEHLLKELQDLTTTTAELARSWITRTQETSWRDRRHGLAEMLNQADGMPNTSDPERFSFWVAKLLDLRPADKLHLLRLTDTRERLNQDLRFLQVGTSERCQLQ